MSEVATATPAAPNFERLKAKLRELFELDKADLDFGIYRILRQRHAEITEFLDKHLEQTVREALTAHGDVQNQQVRQELAAAEENARRLGLEPEAVPKVRELRAQYKVGADPDATADEVYSHLYTFFSRYYQEGDFLGLPRSTVQGRERYRIPYNGEEVKLVWANMDQYHFLDVESAGSASLLDVTQLCDPFHYQMQIATASAGETKATAVDLVETFNWLLGLQVKHIDTQRGFLNVTGELRAGGRTLIIWRSLSDDQKADNKALEKYLARLAINPADTEFDFIYVNGSHTLPDPHNKIHLIEETFQRRMFADQGVSL